MKTTSESPDGNDSEPVAGRRRLVDIAVVALVLLAAALLVWLALAHQVPDGPRGVLK